MDEIIPALYLVATPLGNLADMTPRACDVLSKVDLIACEDTRNAKKLFQLLDIYHLDRRFVSLHAHNEREKSEHIIEVIKKGQSCAYISDAGMPAISDPGAYLVGCAHEKDIRVIPIPGATAVTTAMSVSGFEGEFYFGGFFPRIQKEKNKTFDFLREAPMHVVYYESPQRIISSLRELEPVVNRRIVVCRELTKMFEQIIRGTISKVLDELGEKPKGECVIVIEKSGPMDKNVNQSALVQTISTMKSKGLSSRDVIEILTPLQITTKNMMKDLYQSS